MRLVATSVISLRALRRNKLRSILTALGIIIGVSAFIATVSIGNGAKTQIEGRVASLGQNIVTVFPGSTNTGGARGGFGSASTLTPEDAEAIEREISGITAVSGEVRDRQQVLANGLNWNTTVMGESPDYLSIRNWDLADGSMFTEADVRSAGKVCVVGQAIVRQLFPDGEAIGQTVRIRNLPFKILGVLKTKGYNMFGQDQDDTVIIPYTSAMRRVSRRDKFNSILIQATNADDMPRVQQDITDLLQQRRSGREPDFNVRNQVELAEAFTETARTMTLFLGITAGVSLLVGGIGVMNIMLVSVTERTREIGIRLAIGAHDNDIRLQFLIEAILLTIIGGLMGVAAGIGVSELTKIYLGWAVVVSMPSIVLAVGVSALVGIAFGFYPAHKASQLDPIDALRFE